MKRMLDDYYDRFYNKLATRSAHIRANNYEVAKKIAAWKEEVASHWDCFQVESFKCDQDLLTNGPIVGKEYNFELVIDRHELQGMLGVDLVITKEDPEKHYQVVIKTDQFKLVKDMEEQFQAMHDVVSKYAR